MVKNRNVGTIFWSNSHFVSAYKTVGEVHFPHVTVVLCYRFRTSFSLLCLIKSFYSLFGSFPQETIITGLVSFQDSAVILVPSISVVYSQELKNYPFVLFSLQLHWERDSWVFCSSALFRRSEYQSCVKKWQAVKSYHSYQNIHDD